MTTASLPSTERILRRLFWQLLQRGRVAPHQGQRKTKQGIGIKGTAGLYVLFGILPALIAFRAPPLAFATSLHGLTMMFASLTLAASAGQMLFVREESEILLHRPVRPEHLLRAKAFVLISYALILAGALNAIGLVTGMFVGGFAPLWLPVHAATTVLLMMFSAGVIVLLYNLCLRWFGRERLDGLLTTLQTLLAIVMVLGSQLVPRLMGSQALENLREAHGALLLAPPIWFGALDACLCGQMPFAEAALPAGLALGATVLSCWLAFGRLARSYGKGLMAINEGSGTTKEKTARRPLAGLASSRLLRVWMRDPIERGAFVLASAYLLRDRETKLKIFPGLAPLVVMPLVMSIGPGSRRDEGPAHAFHYMALAYLAIVPIQPLLLLKRSEHYRAAELFRAAPLRHWMPLFHGARKAVLLWLVLPSLVLMFGILAVLRGSFDLGAVGLVVAASLPVYSMVPGLFGPWLPLSQPNRELKDQSIGCLTMGVVMASSAAVVGAAAAAAYFGFGWLAALLAVPLSIAVQAAFARSMAARRWFLAKE